MNKEELIKINVGDIFRTKSGASFQFLCNAIIVITKIEEGCVYYDYLSPNDKKYFKKLKHFNTSELSPVSPVEKELWNFN